jgi:TPR repeat protein
MYFKGRGVAQDAVTSLAWLELAAAQGQENAAMEKAFVASRLTPEQWAKARALAEKLKTQPNKRP